MEKEIIDDLIIQLKDFVVVLVGINDSLAQDNTQLHLYKEFGSIVDRIYGAISMFGPKEISDYIRSIKELCYKCAQSDNPLAYPKVQNSLVDCVEHFCFLRDNLADEGQLKSAIFKINLSHKKVDRIIASYLFSVKESSVGFKGDESYILVFDKDGRLEIDNKERGEVYVPSPKFYNAYGGFKKGLTDKDLSISAIVIDTSCSSNIWMELINCAHQERAAVPLILIAKDISELDSIDRDKLGVKDIIPQKMGLNKIMAHLAELSKEIKKQNDIEEDQVKQSPKDFIEISSTSFKLCIESPYDLYLRIADRFVSIVKKGGAFEQERLNKHIKLGAEVYFVPVDQYNLYMESSAAQLNDFFSDESIKSETKLLKLADFATDICSFIDNQGVDDSKVSMAKEYVERAGSHIEKIAAKNDTCRDFILDLASVEHAVSSSMIAGLFLKILGASDMVYDNIVLACFFHDISLGRTSSNLRNERAELMTDEEKELYYCHHEKSAEMLESFKFRPAIIEAIKQHHMRLDGSGFPDFEKGKSHKVNRIAELIGLIDELLTLIKKEADGQLGYDSIEYLRPVLCLKFSPTIQKAYDHVFPPK